MKKLLVALLVLSIGGAAAFALLPTVRTAVMPVLPLTVQSRLDGIFKTVPVQTEAGSQERKRFGNGPIAVTVQAAGQADFPLVERTYGIVQSPSTIAVNARISSQIVEVHVKDGQTVKAGDLLVSLDDRLLNAQLEKDKAALLKDQALADSAEQELNRAKELFNKKSGTKQAYDQALAAQKSAQATLAADQAAVDADNVQLTFTRIKAPIAGRLGAVKAVAGNLVSAATGASTDSLMTITQMSPLKVNFSLPERNLADIRKEMTGSSQIPVRVFRSSTRQVLETGVLDFIDSAINTSSGTIAMSATLANSKLALWPGQYVDLEIERGVLSGAVVVPTVAIQPGQAGSFVWLVMDGKTVVTQPVKVARSDGGNSAIASGLQPGDQVVIEGQLKLKQNSPVKVTVAAPQQQVSEDGTGSLREVAKTP